ncbi:RNA-binding protein [Erysipelothrix larvae]|uniref:RNA-binding protein n=1 Tax=Erysipelothrix larvae TaxID=1514105 RepID=A0A0X8GZL2_9FIRM|nr:YhbY family RNA-binding protein [Erysipelothrix larvae]AMC93290.1 RNA-binding protein [Erysipelothrix larvae]
MLTNEQKRKLRAIAHHEKTTVYIGKNGLTETVYESFENSLVAHNLVKVTLQKTAPIEKEVVSEELTERFACDLVSSVGRVLVFYRKGPKGRILI